MNACKKMFQELFRNIFGKNHYIAIVGINLVSKITVKFTLNFQWRHQVQWTKRPSTRIFNWTKRSSARIFNWTEQPSAIIFRWYYHWYPWRSWCHLAVSFSILLLRCYDKVLPQIKAPFLSQTGPLRLMRRVICLTYSLKLVLLINKQNNLLISLKFLELYCFCLCPFVAGSVTERSMVLQFNTKKPSVIINPLIIVPIQ